MTRHPFADAIEALHPWAQRVNAAIVEGLLDLNRRLEEARTMTITNAAQQRADAIRERVLTAPIAVNTLADKVDLIARYQPGAEWNITADPELRDTWVLRWDRLELTVGELSDLELARFVVAERIRARQDLRRRVVAIAVELGLEHAGAFRQPATIVVNAGLTRCPGCGANVTARGHRPGSEECHETRRERDLSRST